MKRLPLWPSSAAKWLLCSGQPRIAAIANDWPQEEGKYSEEGTLAHEYLQLALESKPRAHIDLPQGQKDLIEGVAQEVLTLKELGDYELLCEETFFLDFETGRTQVPLMHTMRLKIDIVLVNDTDIVVLDYKHGEGKVVDVMDNPQLLLYLAAVAEAYPGRENLQVGIIQPRGLGEGWSKVDVAQEELNDFLGKVKLATGVAYSPTVEYIKGPHCQFCPGVANPVCPAQLHAAIDTVTFEEDVEDSQLTSWWLLDHLDGLKKIVKGVDEAANVWLKKGRDIAGWCLESRPGRRRWVQPEEVAPILADLLGGKDEDYQVATYKPITLTEATKLAKKAKVNIDALIEQPTVLKRVRGEKILGFEEI